MIDESPAHSSAEIAELCDILRIDDADRSTLESGLHAATLRWRHSKSVSSALVRRTLVRSQLEKIAKATRAASLALSDPALGTWEFMRDESGILNSDHYKSGIEDAALSIGDASPDPEWLVRLVDQHSEVRFAMADIIRCLDVIEEAAVCAATSIPPVKSGPEPDADLARWVYDMRRLVSHRLHIPFTRDITAGGEPITPAARFCVTAYAVLSPKTPEARVLNAMKREITENSEATGGVRKTRF